MLGHPVAGEAEPVGEAREVDAVAQRLRAGDAGGDGREIEDGERRHGKELARPWRFCHAGRRGGLDYCGKVPNGFDEELLKVPNGLAAAGA